MRFIVLDVSVCQSVYRLREFYIKRKRPMSDSLDTYPISDSWER